TRTGFFFFPAEDGIRDFHVTGVQTCALPISIRRTRRCSSSGARPASVARKPSMVAMLGRIIPAPLLMPVMAIGVSPSMICLEWRSEERRVGREGGYGGARGVDKGEGAATAAR